MKFYNKSSCPDDILQPLIVAAGRRIGARTDVVVKVLRPCRGHQGHAYRGRPYLWHLTAKRKGVQSKRLIKSNGGWIELHIPRAYPCFDPMQQAERFWKLCLHEWAHIRDMQDDSHANPKVFAAYNRRWANRPHEQRAIKMERVASEKPPSATAEAAILNLAIWLEETS